MKRFYGGFPVAKQQESLHIVYRNYSKSLAHIKTYSIRNFCWDKGSLRRALCYKRCFTIMQNGNNNDVDYDDDDGIHSRISRSFILLFQMADEK